MLDIQAIRKFLEQVVFQYEKSAPTVSQWADDLYIRLGENVYSVVVAELLQAQALKIDDDEWEYPHFAANRVYKLMNIMGQDTTGHAGF